MQPTIDLEKRFAAKCLWRPFQALLQIGDEGLTLGRGTILAQCVLERGTRNIGEPDGERIVALLCATYERPVAPQVIKYVSRAAARWREGEKALAQIELAFAALPRLQSDEQAYRLFSAEQRLANGMAPRELLRALGFDADLVKYSPDQPRVPGGNGRESGRWTSSAPVAEGRSVAVEATTGHRSDNIEPSQLHFAALRVAANEQFEPNGTDIIPLEGVDPLDPMGLSALPPSLEEQQALADTLTKIASGDADAIKKLEPHRYQNLPHYKTGAVLPLTVGGYLSYTVPLGQRGRGEGRVIVDQATREVYYTTIIITASFT